MSEEEKSETITGSQCSAASGNTGYSGRTGHTGHTGNTLCAEGLQVGYRTSRTEVTPVLRDVSAVIPPESLTVILGPNACGKSTLLGTLAGLLTPQQGRVSLGGEALATLRPAVLARQLSLLPQQPPIPEGITVFDLVARGRYAHQSFFAQWSPADAEAVTEALRRTGLDELGGRAVETLSGGQRQRCWIALALAQDTGLMLLDEPTTYLDVAHQVEVLRLLESLRAEGRTIVAVLHDLNHAARWATHLIAMREGRIHAAGPPAEVFTAETVQELFGMPCRVIEDPDTGSPVVLPR